MSSAKAPIGRVAMKHDQYYDNVRSVGPLLVPVRFGCAHSIAIAVRQEIFTTDQQNGTIHEKHKYADTAVPDDHQHNRRSEQSSTNGLGPRRLSLNRPALDKS